MSILYNFCDFDLYNIIKSFNALSNYEHFQSEVIYFQDLSVGDTKITQNILVNVYDNKKCSYTTELFFNKFKNYNISDITLYYRKDDQYFDLLIVDDLLPWHKLGLTKTRSGYGTKIETTYKAYHNDKFYRVYIDIYSNVGSLYILPNNEKLFLN